MKHRVPTPEEAGYRALNGVDPDVQISCRRCGLFNVKDSECDFWAESSEVQCRKTYSGVACERTRDHRGGCQRAERAPDGDLIGWRVLDRASWFAPAGSIAPDD